MGGDTSAATIASLEFWSSFGFWTLVVGLVGDVAVLTIPKHRDRLEKVLSALFTIVIIVGVAIEHRADSELSRETGVKIATLERDAAQFKKEAAVATKDAAEAMRKATEAESHLAEARERAAKAEKATEEERIARLTLEAQIAPRTLTLDQQASIAAAVRRFSGRRVIVITYGLDLEGRRLGKQIVGAFSAAGLRIDPNIGGEVAMGIFSQGIQVYGPAKEQDLIKAIAQSLVHDGKLLEVSMDAPPESGVKLGAAKGFENAVTVRVGVKPLVMLGGVKSK